MCLAPDDPHLSQRRFYEVQSRQIRAPPRRLQLPSTNAHIASRSLLVVPHFFAFSPEIDQAANYHFALSFLTSLSTHPRKRSDPSRAYSCETRVLQKGRTCRHAYRLPWPQARRRGRQLLRSDELLISR